ncbi:MAG: pyrophosphate--fructose-6-phosphate 1-phosphotransferase [Verrucomicrobiales bacterium]|jgi:pyrophosphate--fructose-6-phosphate 1-phosphotransferase|nr:pyrophosphate--fructose-6-phosphate 1-phosphotransferase [Verrucomicrobiales bacterium]
MRIAFLTAGGIAPCLSASIGGLIESYNEIAPEADLMGYLNGYQGLLLGNSYHFPKEVRQNAAIFYNFGGSPIGNSRVKLTNVEDCTKRGLVKPGEIPLKVAADRLVADGVDILHTIGGDDTNTTAADLAAYLEENNYKLTVVGMPKTIDNDVFPIKQTLGAWTAAHQSARFFRNVANENTTSARQLIIHEVMGRHCGWLTARAAYEYHESLHQYDWMPTALLHQLRWDVDAVWVPEMEIDLDAEIDRLNAKMDEHDSVNIFLSEGAGMDNVIAELKAKGQEPEKDAFGHYRLDDVNVGRWFGEQLQEKLGAEKLLIQKSGYFARSAAPNDDDLELIKASARHAAESALRGESGVAGLDEDNNDIMSTIAFPRIKGGKPFDIDESWFTNLLEEIGQPKGRRIEAH